MHSYHFVSGLLSAPFFLVLTAKEKFKTNFGPFEVFTVLVLTVPTFPAIVVFSMIVSFKLE